MKNLAFIFPGQGSQSIGMGKDFFENSDIAKNMIAQASKRLDIDLVSVFCFFRLVPEIFMSACGRLRMTLFLAPSP